MKFDIKKTTIGDDVQIEISQPQFMPTYNYAENSASDYKLVPLVDSSQAEYFETIKSLMENYSQKVDVVSKYSACDESTSGTNL